MINKLDLKKITHLNTAFEIAKRMSFQKSKSNTSFIVTLSIAATSISIAAIILTCSIVNGFQEQIAQKVYQFWGSIRINPINGNVLNESPQLLNAIEQLPEVKSVQPYATQTAVIAYEKEMEGIIVKGMNKRQSIPFLQTSSNLRELLIEKNDEVAEKPEQTLYSVMKSYFDELHSLKKLSIVYDYEFRRLNKINDELGISFSKLIPHEIPKIIEDDSLQISILANDVVMIKLHVNEKEISVFEGNWRFGWRIDTLLHGPWLADANELMKNALNIAKSINLAFSDAITKQMCEIHETHSITLKELADAYKVKAHHV